MCLDYFVSIQTLTKGFNCSVIFYLSHCEIQEKDTKRMIRHPRKDFTNLKKLEDKLIQQVFHPYHFMSSHPNPIKTKNLVSPPSSWSSLL